MAVSPFGDRVRHGGDRDRLRDGCNRNAGECVAYCFSLAQVTQLNSTIRTAIADDGYPGMVVGIWGPNGERYVRAFGSGDLETKRPLTIRDRFRVGSITKTFVGTLVLELVQQHLLSLNERLSHFFKWIPDAKMITIRVLLDHTSLIPEIAKSTVQELKVDPSMRFVPDQVIRSAVAQPYFPPPPAFNYSDVDYLILGRIAEKVTGQRSLKRLLAQRVVAPRRWDSTTPTSTRAPRSAVHTLATTPCSRIRWST